MKRLDLPPSLILAGEVADSQNEMLAEGILQEAHDQGEAAYARKLTEILWGDSPETYEHHKNHKIVPSKLRQRMKEQLQWHGQQIVME